MLFIFGNVLSILSHQTFYDDLNLRRRRCTNQPPRVQMNSSAFIINNIIIVLTHFVLRKNLPAFDYNHDIDKIVSGM
jgi:hypothetical protein